METTSQILQTAGDFRQHYVGKHITQLPKPALVLDKAKMHRHCKSLLDAVEYLGVDFRAHVKTHKVVTVALFLIFQTLRADIEMIDSGRSSPASWGREKRRSTRSINRC